MPNQPRETSILPASPVYRVVVRGELSAECAAGFEGLTAAALDDGDTLLCGPALDQAALFTALRKARDLGLTIVSVTLAPAKG